MYRITRDSRSSVRSSKLPSFDRRRYSARFSSSLAYLLATIDDSPKHTISRTLSANTLAVTKNARKERSCGVCRSIDGGTVDCRDSQAAYLLSRGIAYPSLDNTLRRYLLARFAGSTMPTIGLSSEMESWKNNQGNDSCHIHRQADSSLANRNAPLLLSSLLCRCSG